MTQKGENWSVQREDPRVCALKRDKNKHVSVGGMWAEHSCPTRRWES